MTEEKSKPEKPRPVMQEEFREFKEKVDKGFGAILEKLEEIKKIPSTPEIKPLVVEGGPTVDNQVPVPPLWDRMKCEILSPDILGTREDMPSGEIKYNLFIPREMSTADQQHWLNYKQDKRTIIVKNGERSVKEGLIKIRNNLIAGGYQNKLVQYNP